MDHTLYHTIFSTHNKIRVLSHFEYWKLFQGLFRKLDNSFTTMMLFSNKKREYTYTYVISSDWAGRARFRLESCAGSRLKSALEVRQSTPAGAQSKRSLEMSELKYEVSSFK